MRYLVILLLLCLPFILAAQTSVIRGRLTDKIEKTAITGANVSLLDTYDGATTDADGRFQFSTDETGAQTLQITFLGYDTLTQKLNLKGDTLTFNLMLREGFNELKTVVISAGTFEASDEKKVTVLKPLDIVTTASAGGDTYGALKTLPGAQVSTGDQEGLFVRGGTGSEAPTFIDGLLVRNPFFASTPDFAARGRFNPFLFKGTVFSTGGYSAQYGQGMSSAIVLETQDLPDRSAGSLAVSVVGLGYGQQKLWREQGRAAGININYTHLGPYFSVVDQQQNFTHNPEFLGTEGFFRQKTKADGLFKFYGYFNTGEVGFKLQQAGATPSFSVKNHNYYSNMNWSGLPGNNWRLTAGLSASLDRNEINSTYDVGFLQPDKFEVKNSLLQARVTASRLLGRLTTVRFGGEHQWSHDAFDSESFGTSAISDHYSALFVESDLYFTRRLVARAGLRGEYTSLLNQAAVAPRLSVAYKLGANDQVSFAWGYFYQKGDSLLRWNNQYDQLPGLQRAEHYIANYQFIGNDRTFRIEGYYKRYSDLVATYEGISNDGQGYAKGLELFFRDRKTFKNFDYWISYSWLDTKRRFWWYPSEVQPTYAANHVASLVVKQFISKLKTSLGATYNYASGRPYYNPNRPQSEFLTDRTPEYHNLSLSASYLTTVRKAFTVLVLSVSNVLGQQQVFGYRYSADGSTRSAITPGAPRFIFIGAFFSWGIDRRQEILDKQ